MNRQKLSVAALSVLLLIVFMPSVSAAEADNGLAALRQMSKAFSEVSSKAIPAVVFVNVQKCSH